MSIRQTECEQERICTDTGAVIATIPNDSSASHQQQEQGRKTCAVSNCSSDSNRPFKQESSSNLDIAPNIGSESITLVPVTTQIALERLPLTTIDIYAVQVEQGKHSQYVFDFVRRKDVQDILNRMGATSNVSHLKRVKKLSSDEETSQVMICAVSQSINNEEEKGEIKHVIQRVINENQDIGKDGLQLEVFMAQAPAHAAYTREQHKEWSAVWPVSFLPPRSGPKRLQTGMSETTSGDENDSSNKEELVQVGGQKSKDAWKKWVIYHMLGTIEHGQDADKCGDIESACRVVRRGPEDESENMGEVIAETHDTRRTSGKPLAHAVMNAIDIVARKYNDEERKMDEYLLTSYHVFTTHEPCMMCAMALVHSRVASLYFVRAAGLGGGLGGGGAATGLHELGGLNHRFRTWRAAGLERGVREMDMDT